MINRRRIVRSPRFETAPSFCLPPVDFCSGVSPSQAAKSRPAANPSAAGTNAVIAVEAIGPTPGIVISRRAVGSFLERRALFIATEGNGRWIEYAGGYTDMLAQRASAGRGTPPAKGFRNEATAAGHRGQSATNRQGAPDEFQRSTCAGDADGPGPRHCRLASGM